MAQDDNNELPVSVNPTDKDKRRTAIHLPNFFRTNSNKKFLAGTLDVFTQPGKLSKISSYVGRRDIPNYEFDDNYIQETSTPRQYYQLEPSFIYEDPVTQETKWFGDYIDYINSLKYFGANVANHSKLNKQEAYTWNPHIDWDKLVNYREYYWLPNGPDPVVIFGELEKQISEFTVTAEDQGDNVAYVFTPDGLTANPRIVLYRGLTYKFKINTPGKPFSIKTRLETGDSYFYNIGVSDRKVEKGTITFTVPYEAPDLLYYLDNKDIETAGLIDIKDLDEARKLNVEEEIIGKRTYTSSFDIDFINGLVVKFAGQVTPEKYLEGFWYVEGVGDRIKLVNTKDLESPATFIKSIDLPFDDQPFDSMPWDNADNFPSTKDYMVINRASRDRNNWSRANRWFHKNVVETSAQANKRIPEFDQNSRAQRPIIEFDADLKLHKHGWFSKTDIDLVDTTTTDVFSIIEGSTGYIVDGEQLVPGYRILFTGDPDILVKGKIFEVKQILNVNVNASENISIISTSEDNDLFTVPSTNTLRVGMRVQFSGTVVGGVTSGVTYFISPTNFTPTTFSVSLTANGPLVQLTNSAVLTMKVSNVGVGTTQRKVQLTLQEIEETEPLEGQCVYITKGRSYKGSTFYYENGEWKLGQKKIQVNQPPLFDLFDENLDSYEDTIKYPFNTFNGNRIFGYKVGTGIDDQYLGFPIIYRNITNIGDIEFEFELQNQTWEYINSGNNLQPLNSTGSFLRKLTSEGNFTYTNGWVRTERDTEQNVIRILKIEQETDLVPIDVYDDNVTLNLLEEISRISTGSNFYIAKQESSGQDLQDSQYWNDFDYNELYKINWDPTTIYYQNDIVSYNRFTYISIADPIDENKDKVPTNTLYWKLLHTGYANKGNFSRVTEYKIDDVINFEGSAYIAIQDNINLSPTNINYWKKIVKGSSKFIGEYSSGTRYKAKDIVSYGLYLYIAKRDTTEILPTDINDWNRLSVGTVYPKFYNKKTLYKLGDIVVLDRRPKLDYRIRVYVNNKKRSDLTLETIEGIAYIKFANKLSLGDKVVYKIRSLANKNLKGYYEIPVNWQNNPFNQVVDSFTFGEVIDHVRTVIETAGEFSGEYPGNSNLANLGSISQYGRKFMQHTGSMALASFLMIDKDANIIKALRWASREYTQFKKEILVRTQTNAFDGSTREIVDQLLQNYTQSKYYNNSAFYFSEMLPFGAASVREYTVIDPRFPVFVIDSFYNPRSQTSRCILIYVNEQQILYGKDYVFDDDDAFVRIIKPLNIDDKILIKDYANTDGCYVPFTPTKLGLYPLYEPTIYNDDTYLNQVFVAGTVVNVKGITNEFRTDTAHNLEIGDSIKFLDDNLPAANISKDTVYFVSSIPSFNSFTLTTSVNGGPVDIEKDGRGELKFTFTATSLFKNEKTAIKVIQGHDGSIIRAYNDYRDDVILEIENRIYNSIKITYDPDIFDINSVIPGYYRRTDFTKNEITDILLSEFLRWNAIPKLDFNTNNYFIGEETFSYNYNNSLSPNGQEPLYGYWRGIYKYFFDTDRPHTHPWEMQGFTIKPIWWDDVYGLAPYTSDNKIMWDNIEQGLIADPNDRRTNLKFARPGLKDYLPVDNQGNLLSPLTTNLAQNFSVATGQGRFAFGDQAPVETAWRRSSEFPFSIIIACTVLRNSEYIGKMWDRYSIKKNIAGQVYSTIDNKKVSTKNIPFANSTNEDGSRLLTSGLCNIIDEYVRIQKNIDHDYYKKVIRGLDIKLAYRIGGFTNQERIKVLLDSRSPNSSGTIFLPQESYRIFYNKSAPVDTVNYSGVIIEKRSNGYAIDGYDKEKNSFEIFVPRPSASDPTFNVGGVSESFVEWTAEKFYTQGQLVRYESDFYRSKVGHTSSTAWQSDTDKWQRLPGIPLTGGRDAVRRKQFKEIPVRIPYGTIFTDIQSIVDFLLGYQERLKAWGFEFEEFSKDLEVPLNWLTSAKEFMFWTLQNWSSGSVIFLSPAANYLKFKPVIVASVDNLDEDFYGYSIFKADGQPLRSDLTNIYREDNGFEIKPASNTTDGIFHIRTNLVYSEHVIVFDNISIFNDVIYDVVPGYRQGRLKLLGFKTNNWDGSYYSPGFAYDKAEILEWQPNTDYNLGDIVKYQNYYFTALDKILGESNFDLSNDKWQKLDEEPKDKLLSNFDYRIEQFRDFYSLESSNFDNNQQSLARHLIGYQPRQYLENIINDDVSQYKFYQGFIREKGTLNSVTKLFDALRASGFSSIELKEEWAFKVGDFGASDAYTELEFILEEDKFTQNPQGVKLTIAPELLTEESIYNIPRSNVTKKPRAYNANPFVMKAFDYDQVDYGIFKYRVAGYVNPEDVKHYVIDENTLFNYPLDILEHRDKIWVANSPNGNWNVMAFFNTRKLIYDWQRDENVLSLYVNENIDDIQVGNIIAIKNLFFIDGIYKVIGKFQNIIQIFTANATLARITEDSTAGILFKFESVRYPDISSVNLSRYNDLKIKGEKLWIDRDINNRWLVLENEDVFAEKKITPPTFIRSTENSLYGYQVKVSGNQKILFASAIGNGAGRVLVYTRPNNSTDWAFLQTIKMPDEFNIQTGTEKFGYSIDVSDDGLILVISAPDISGIKSYFKGDFDTEASYSIGDIVRFNGELWQNLEAVNGDGSTIDINTDDWQRLDEIYEVFTSASTSGLTKQGVVFVYVFDQTSRRFYERDSLTVNRTVETPLGTITLQALKEQVICSYDPQSNERFGTKIKLVQENNEYWLYVTSEMPDKSGRIQIFKREASGRWIYNSQRYLNFDNLITLQTFTSTYTVVIDEPNLSTLGQIRKFVNNYLGDVILRTPAGNIINGLSVGKTLRISKGGIVYLQVTVDNSIPLNPKYNYTVTTNTNFTTSEKLFPQPEFRYGFDISATVRDVVVSAPFLDSGATFIFQRDGTTFSPIQVIDEETIADGTTVNNSSLSLEEIELKPFDNFGDSVLVNGNSLFVSSPNCDLKNTNVGAVYHFEYDSLMLRYELTELILPPSRVQNERFGVKIDSNSDSNLLAVSAAGGDVILDTTFDTYSDRVSFTADSTRNYQLDENSEETAFPTIFDAGATLFFDQIPFTGAVYVFNRFDDSYIYADKLEAIEILRENDSFGSSISVCDNSITVGAPNREINNINIGTVYTFDYNEYSWTVKETQGESVDVEKFKKAFIYNSKENKLITELDFYDPAKGRIPGPANQEIKYQTLRDPASYEFTINNDIFIDQTQPWTDDHIGELWWDLSAVKWIWYEQSSITYRNNAWGVIFPGSSIDIYEWIESSLLPSEYLEQTSATGAEENGITGTPLYINDFTYSSKVKYDSVTGLNTTLYYYWVKNRKTVPNVPFRRIPTTDVAQLIIDPASVGYKFIAVTGKNSFSLFNVESSLKDSDVSLNVQYYEVDNTDLIVHREYALLAEDDANTIIPSMLENKWFDSLCGYNKRGQPVPDTRLSFRERYGSAYEPRQSWFANRFEALKQYFEYVNSILLKTQIIDDVNFTNLLSAAPAPNLNSGEIDRIVDILDDLRFIGTSKIKTASVVPVILDGRITDVIVTDPGGGYIIPPTIKVFGPGTGAKLKANLNTNGSISSVTVVKGGKEYEPTATTLSVRNHTVLVSSDEEALGGWSVHSWSGVKKSWNRIKTQAYNVPRYWSYVDWYAEGYSSESEILFQYNRSVDLNGSLAQVGDIVKIADVGGWLLLERIAITESSEAINDYKVVGRQNSTIQFSESLYNLNKELGYDTKFSYDLSLYDQTPTVELRIILESIRDDILVDNLRQEYIKLFFNNVHYALHEHLYVDWVFKTSFLKINHNVGTLRQRITFQGDELESYQKYIEEIKPYKSKIREYVSSYGYTDPSNSQITDFDLFSYYDYSSGRIERGSLNSSVINSFPWKSWADNRFYEVTEIEVYDQGNGYISIPKVIITGDGRDASATAYIANGKVYKIIVDNPGSGYTKVPTIFISGGNGDIEENRARAFAKIGNNLVRTNHITMKYDRYAFTNEVAQLRTVETFRGTGVNTRFKLKYAPDPKKVNFNILVNNIEIYGSGYDVEIIEVLHDTYTTLEGYVNFAVAPSINPITPNNVRIEYDKNIRILGATDRINKAYSPVEGQYGKEYGLLMTGIDYGGVQLTSIDFDIAGGWDVLPWDVSSWDNIVSTNDDYVVISDGTTQSFELPYIPANGEVINVYITSVLLDENGEPIREFFGAVKTKTVRVDDPYFSLYDGSTEQPNGLFESPEGTIMDSFVGNGVNKVIVIPVTYNLLETDFITFRKSTSDGTILPTDRSLIDSFVDGGDIAYATAKGISADEIIVDGDGFITSDTSHGPEELVQGQVVDALEVKVYHTPSNGGPNVQVRNYTGDGITKTFDIGFPLSTVEGIIVISNGVVLTNIEDSSLADNDPGQYIVNFKENTITMNNAPGDNHKVAIISIDTAGYDITEKVLFTGDGLTTEYLTSSRWNDGDFSAFVTINGVSVEFFVKESDDDYAVGGNVIIQFESPPFEGDIIQIIMFRGTIQKWSEINTQYIPIEVGKYEYSLSPKPANLGPLSATAFVIIDNEFLQAPDYEFFTYTGQPLEILDRRYGLYEIRPQDINVFKNGIQLVPIVDYVLDNSVNKVTLSSDVAVIGDQITIEIFKYADFRVDVKSFDGSSNVELSVVLNSAKYILINQKVMRVITFTNHDIIKIKTSNEGFRFNTGYDVLQYDIVQYDILSTAINTSGIFDLPRTVGSNSGVFVALSRKLLTPNVDYVVLDNKKQIKVLLPEILKGNDYLQIVTFDDKTVQPSYGFKLFKDMTNRYSFKRLDSSSTTTLVEPLTYLDTRIIVEDGSILSIPNRNLNAPGVIEIDGERIEYLVIQEDVNTGNWILRQLRRGTLGTGIKNFYDIGTEVNDIGPSQTLPYTEIEIKKTFYGDETTRIFEVDYIPTLTTVSPNKITVGKSYRIISVGTTDFTRMGASSNTVGNIFTATRTGTGTGILAVSYFGNFGHCDDIEVFVAGRRLIKNPYSRFNESKAQDSFNGAGDELIEAEFSVDGVNYGTSSAPVGRVRITNSPGAGELVVIVRKTGRLWQKIDEDNSLVFSNTEIAGFLRARQVFLPK